MDVGRNKVKKMLKTVFSKNQEEKLYSFSSSKLHAEYYIQFESEYCVTLEYAIENVVSKNPNLKSASQRFLDYYSVLIRKPSDFLLIDKFKFLQRKNEALKILCESRLLSDEMLYALFQSQDVINLFPSGEWLDVCARRFVKVLVNFAEGSEISWREAFPNNHEIPDFTKQYIYSWIYEEGRMDSDFLQRFRHEFPAKYKHLSSFLDGG